MADKKKKMPPQLLEYFKNKNKKKEDGKEMSDKEKRMEALEKAREVKKKSKKVPVIAISVGMAEMPKNKKKTKMMRGGMAKKKK